MTYVYDADGTKLEKVSGGVTRDYINGIEYNNGSIEFVTTEEGRAIPSGSTYTYEYYLQDYLGNIRAAIKQDGSIIQVQDYYAFGAEMNPGNSLTPSPANQYKYSGKEKQPETGDIDFGARNYDPVIGRWTAIDLLAEVHPDINPYNYVLNNPINFIDQFGIDTIKPNQPLPPDINKGDVVQADGKNYTVNEAGGTITGKKQSNSEDNSGGDNIIIWGPNANRRVVSSYTLRKINEIMDASNNHNIFITSTQRTPRGQARAMYHNILTHGVAFSYKLYGRYGDMVTHIAEEGIANGESDDEIVNDMTDKIISLGPQNVSRHSADPNVVNVLDISPGSLQNKHGFIQAARDNGIYVIPNPPDPAVHIEITQP